jgi:hypothetical protein
VTATVALLETVSVPASLSATAITPSAFNTDPVPSIVATPLPLATPFGA